MCFGAEQTQHQHLILIVDDEREIRETLARIAHPGGHRCLVAASAREALSILADVPPCLLLLDLNMPGMSGLELLRRIRSDSSLARLPVAIVTGSFEEQVVQECVALGVVDFIRKPFDRLETQLRIATQLSLHSTQQQSQRGIETLRAITNAARDAIILMDGSGAISHWTPAAEAIFGYSAAEVVGQDLHGLLAPARFREPFQSAFRTFKATGQGRAVGQSTELVGLRKSGEEFPLELSLSAIHFRGQWCAVGIVRDATQRLRAEQALRESERRLRALFDQTFQFIGLLSPDGTLLDVNRTALQFAGISQDQVLGRLFWETPWWTHDSQLQTRLRESVQRACAGETTRFEVTHISAQGDLHYIDFSLKPVRDEHGQVVFLVPEGRDITEQKRAAEALRRSEERFRVGFEKAAVGHAILSLDGFLLEVNATLAKELGEPVERLVGRNLCELAHPDDRDKCTQVFASWTGPPAREERIQRMALRLLGPHDTVLHFEIGAALLPGGDGIPRQAIGTFVNVTEQKRAQALEAKLLQAQKLEAIGQLAAGIAHEINTPTQFVSDSVGFLSQASEDLVQLIERYQRVKPILSSTDEGRSVVLELNRAEEAADLLYLREHAPKAALASREGLERIANIVRAMKEFSHPDQPEKCPADLNQALQNTLIIAHNEYKYVAEVVSEFGDLPLVPCHLGSLNQVFLNLLVNAAHAITEVVGQSGRKGTIRIRTFESGDRVVIQIADTGAGIPDSIRHRIFEPFFTSKPVGKGTGQGLAIARSIVVHKHGGTLEFDSEPGVGTTFTLQIPTRAVG